MARRGRSFDAGGVLGGTFRAWARNLVPFSVIAFVIQSPFLVYTWFVLRRAEGGQIETIDELVETVTTWGAVIGIGTVLLGFVVTGAVSYGVFQQLRGRPAALFDCVAVGLRKLLPVLGVGLVAGVAVGAPLIVAVLLKMPILMIALVIPTIVLYCMFWVAVPVAVVERQSVFAAMRRSAQLTKGYKGSIFGVAFILGIIERVVDAIVQNTLENVESLAVIMWVTVGVAIAVSLLTSVAAAVGYHDLRAAKEGVGVEELIEVFA